MLKFISVLSLTLIVMLPVSVNAANEDAENEKNEQLKTLSFAVVPQQSASKLARLWTPILDQVSKQIGVRILFKTAKDIPTFEKRLAKGEYDIAYMNPYHYTVYSINPGYQAIAKAKDKKIKGIIVVKKNSSITDIQQLSGHTLAFPAPAAFAATVLPRAYFSHQKMDVKERYVSSHDSVYRAVAKDLFVAGGGVLRTLKNLKPEIREQLKILWTSKAYTPHAIAVHPRLKQSLQKKLQSALSTLHQTKKGNDIIKNLKLKGFSKAEDKDWDDVRQLNINLL
jgi:phosphonate transport system substrate-binding protein